MVSTAEQDQTAQKKVNDDYEEKTIHRRWVMSKKRNNSEKASDE